MKLGHVDAELDEETAARLRKALETDDEATVDAIVEPLLQQAEKNRLLRELHSALMRDVILNAHHWAHEGNQEKVMTLLCPMATMLDGTAVPVVGMLAFMNAINEGNVARAKHDCAGHA